MLSCLLRANLARETWLQIGFTLSLLVPGSLAWAWGDVAHRVACEITWLEMEPALRRQVKEWVDASNHTLFHDTCVWADRVRSVSRYRFAARLHYMNVPRDSVSLGDAAQCLNCILDALRGFSLRFAELPPSRYEGSTRAEAFLFLNHLVGDLHQPLHVAYAEDRGGNDFPLRLGKRRDNLHALWDNALPRRVIGRDWRNTARHWQAGITAAQRTAWTAGDETAWAEESLQVTRQIYARWQPEGTLQEAELTWAEGVVRERLTLAGVRLAARLRILLPSANPAPSDRSPHQAGAARSSPAFPGE